MTSLPLEIFLEISKHLKPVTLVALACTNKSFYQFFKSSLAEAKKRKKYGKITQDRVWYAIMHHDNEYLEEITAPRKPTWIPKEVPELPKEWRSQDCLRSTGLTYLLSKSPNLKRLAFVPEDRMTLLSRIELPDIEIIRIERGETIECMIMVHQFLSVKTLQSLYIKSLMGNGRNTIPSSLTLLEIGLLDLDRQNMRGLFARLPSLQFIQVDSADLEKYLVCLLAEYCQGIREIHLRPIQYNEDWMTELDEWMLDDYTMDSPIETVAWGRFRSLRILRVGWRAAQPWKSLPVTLKTVILCECSDLHEARAMIDSTPWRFPLMEHVKIGPLKFPQDCNSDRQSVSN